MKNLEYIEKVAIATTTWYNPDSEADKVRSGLAEKSVKEATNLGYEIVVVDGGSSDELLRIFENFGARVYSQNVKGMGPGRRQAMQIAHDIGRTIVAWTEPEKHDYIFQLIKTVKPIIKGESDLVVPKRKSLACYPTAQQYAEPLGNAFWKVLTGHDLDMWSGPRTWRRELSHYFLDYDGEYGDKWDSIFIPVMDAIHAGEKVISVEVNYTHPKEQARSEENDPVFFLKRMEQLDNLMRSFDNHWKKLTKN